MLSLAWSSPLTTGADNIVGDGSDDIINGNLTSQGLQTFQSWDTIDGGAGTNTLNVQNTGANVITANLANIQSLNFQDTTAAGAVVTLNLKGLSSLTAMGLEGNSGGSGYTINNLGSLPAITLTGTGAANTINFTSAALQPAGQNLNLTLTGVTGAAGLTLSDTGSNTLEAVTITAQDADSNVGVLTTSGLGVTTLNVAGGSNLTMSQITDTGATLRTINASTATGNLTISNAATSGLLAGNGLLGTTGVLTNTTVTGGDGNDVVGIIGGGSNSISLGAGNDRVNVTAGLANTDTITGGDGTDALRTTSAQATGYAAVATDTITGIETLQLSDALGAALTTANLSTDIVQVDLLAGAGAFAINMGAGTATVNVGRSDTTAGFDIVVPTGVAGNLTGLLTVADTGTATTDVLNLNNVLFNQTTGLGVDGFNGQSLTVNGYETVNLGTGVAGGTSTVNVVTLTGDAGANTSLVISGSQTLTAAGAITATTVNASALVGSDSAALNGQAAGVRGLVMAVAAAAGLTSITGSAYADWLQGDASSSIAGGAGNDSLAGGTGADTLLGQDGNDSILGGGGNDSIDGGAGNDYVSETAANVTVNDTITGGDGTADRLELTAMGAALNATALSGISAFEILQVAANATLNQSMSDFANNTGFTEIRADGPGAGLTLTFSNVGSTTNTLGLTGATAGTIVFDRLVDVATNALTVNSRAAAALTGLTADDEETITFNTTQNNADGTTTARNTDVGALTANDITTLNVNGAGTFNAVLGATSTALATVNASGSTNTVTIDANTSLAAITATAGSGIFNFTAGGGADSVTGSDLGDSLVGNAGNDTLIGNLGNDILVGGTGADSISGGGGTDTYSAVGTSNVLDGGATASYGQVINLSATGITAATIAAAPIGNAIASSLSGVASNTAAYLGFAGTISGNVDTLSAIENVTGSAGRDYIVGSAGANTIDGGAGGDVMTGGAAADTFGAANSLGSTGSSIVASTVGLTGAAIAAADTMVFATKISGNAQANNLDIITDFVSGTDKLDVVTAATAPTNLVGLAVAATTVAGTTYVAYGAYNNATSTFTVAAGYGAGNTDAILYVGDGALTAGTTTGYVLLTSLNQALVAADFV